MACPTCGHTMQQAPPVWWCPRCGTLKTNNREDALGTHEPWLVERVVNFFEAASEEDKEKIRAGIEECLSDGHP